MKYSNGGSGGQPAVTNNKAWNDLNTNIPKQVMNEAGSSNLPGKDGGPYDAYRHMLWLAEMTRRYGEDLARLTAEVHEFDGRYRGGQSPASEAIDRNNNEIGIGIGRNAKSWEDVVRAARDEISRGAKSSSSGGSPVPGPSVKWLPESQWRQSDKDPNPAPRDTNQQPLPRNDWNGLKQTGDDVKWPGSPFPIPKTIPIPPPGNLNIPDSYYDYYRRPEFNKEFRRGVNWTRPSDPLVFDLDGDGIELTAGDADVLFDHNADSIKTGTQWAKSDDAMLVRDLNGNGVIDSGRELFGDQTRLPNGQLAANGFQALSALDSNGDGMMDANDAAFAELKVWRDQNQDGVSQASELQSLDQAGITSINLAANAQGASTFTKTSVDANGNPISIAQAIKNINLTTNNFYSEFTDNPAVTDTASALPQMQGAGQVRDLREAMSLGTAQSQALEQTLNTFKAATTTQARQAQLSTVVNAWANTSALSAALARNPIPGNPSNWYLEFPDKQQTGERQ